MWVQKKRKTCFSLRESGKGLGGPAALGLDLQRQGGAPQEEDWPGNGEPGGDPRV